MEEDTITGGEVMAYAAGLAIVKLAKHYNLPYDEFTEFFEKFSKESFKELTGEEAPVCGDCDFCCPKDE